MSLIVWMPLNGDVDNHGVGKLNYISGTPVYANDGKLGKCLDLSVNPTLSFSCDELNGLDGSCITIAFWVNVLTGDTSLGDWRRILFLGDANSSGTSGSGFRFEACFNSSLRACSTHNNTTNNIWGASHLIIPNDMKNQWHHVCVTMDGSSIKSYRDGVLIAESTSGKGTGHFNGIIQFGHGGAIRGKLNDFRIYDRALSLQEIKILSQCLLLHYPMTGGGRSGDNLVVGTQRNQYSTDLTLDNDRKSGMLSAGSGGNGVFSITEEDVPVGIYSYNVTNNTSGNRDYQQGGIPFISGKQYTASWWAKGNGSCLFRSWNRTRGAEVIRDTWTLTSNWKYYTRTFTATQAMQDDCCTFHLGVTGSASIKIAGMKLEEGSHATPWMPNSADTAYTTMGYNTNTEYDTSGYLHNGTINGSVSYSSDSARYSVSTEFSKSGFISVPSFNVDTSAFTLNFWVKMKTATSQHFVLGTFSSWTGNGIGVYRDANAEWYSCLIRSAGESSYRNFSLYPTVGSWHMLTLTYDGTNYKGYLNGILKQNATYGSGGVVSNPVFMVGNSKFNGTPSSENEEAFVSDVRFYATALSAEDIQKLYNTAVSISNNGTLMGYELIEN